MPPRSSLVLSAFLLLACGGDEPERESEGAPSSATDAAPNGASDAAPDASTPAASSDAGASSDASVLDASSGSDGSSASSDAGEPPPALTLSEALQQTGMDSSSERALLVIEAGCKQIGSCGAMQPVASCVDDTMGEWVVGALFFSDACLDAQLDFYACLAETPCTADTMTACATQRTAQTQVCAES